MQGPYGQEQLGSACQGPHALVASFPATASAMGKKGLMIKYVPSYAPELKLIEILWRFLKYYWLPFSA